MVLQDMYFIAEIIGVVAVVASLLFVGRQLVLNTKALRLNAAQANTADWTATPKWLASDRDLMDAIAVTGHEPPETWSPQDAFRLRSFALVVLKNLELNFLQWSDGNLDDELWFAARDGAIAFFAVSSFIEPLWRQDLSRNFPPRFQKQVEEIFELGAAELAEKGTITSITGTRKVQP